MNITMFIGLRIYLFKNCIIVRKSPSFRSIILYYSFQSSVLWFNANKANSDRNLLPKPQLAIWTFSLRIIKKVKWCKKQIFRKTVKKTNISIELYIISLSKGDIAELYIISLSKGDIAELYIISLSKGDIAELYIISLSKGDIAELYIISLSKGDIAELYIISLSKGDIADFFITVMHIGKFGLHIPKDKRSPWEHVQYLDGPTRKQSMKIS